jgi:hypothetical protein
MNPVVDASPHVASSRLDHALARESALLGREARLSLIAAAVIGAMELASGLDEEGTEGLRRALFLGALRALELREATRQKLKGREGREE